MVIDLNTLNDWDKIIEMQIPNEIAKRWFNPFSTKSNLTGYSFNIFIETFLRVAYLTNKKFNENIQDISYINFVKNLYYFNIGEKKVLEHFMRILKHRFFFLNGKGSPRKDYIFINKPSEKYRIAQRINLKTFD